MILSILIISLLFVARILRLRDTKSKRARAVRDVSAMVSATEPPTYSDVDVLSRRYSLSTLTYACCYVADMLSGPCLYRLSTIADRCGIYDHLRREAACTVGAQRAHNLALLSRFPLSRRYYDYVESYAEDCDERVRFYALVVQLVADADRAVEHLAAEGLHLSSLACAELLALLRRGDCPLAWTPLLRSGSYNLRMLGLAVVSHFEIADSEPLLYDIIARGDTSSLVALYALATIRGDVERAEVRCLVVRLNMSQRDSLARHLARCGYPPQTMDMLLTPPLSNDVVDVAMFNRSAVCS